MCVVFRREPAQIRPASREIERLAFQKAPNPRSASVEKQPAPLPGETGCIEWATVNHTGRYTLIHVPEMTLFSHLPAA